MIDQSSKANSTFFRVLSVVTQDSILKFKMCNRHRHSTLMIRRSSSLGLSPLLQTSSSIKKDFWGVVVQRTVMSHSDKNQEQIVTFSFKNKNNSSSVESGEEEIIFVPRDYRPQPY